jgi:AcrR family transcriptional regulator
MARRRTEIAPRIVAAAREKFLAQGVDGASLREIAREGGTNIGMVYYYFPTKDDLLLAVVEEIYRGMAADIRAALSLEAPLEERIRALYARIAAMSDEEFTVVRIVLREALVSSDRLRKLFDRFSVEGGHVQLIAATVLSGIEEGSLRPDLHPLLAMVATMALGFLPVVARRLALSAMPAVELPAPEEMAANLTRALLEGIGRSTARRGKLRR